MGLTPTTLVATSATCMALVQLSRGVGFGLGSAFNPAILWGGLTLATGVVVGNALGAKILARMPRLLFRQVLIATMTLAAMQMLWGALA